MNSENKSTNTRQAILQAAAQLILQGGVNRLTLEAVAKKAGVSKGGLLYHFPGKEELVRGLIEQLNTEFDRDLQSRVDAMSPATGRWLKAYVEATFATNNGWSEADAALLAAISNDPALLEPFRRSYDQYQRQLEQAGLNPALATIIRLAADGLWLAELFDLAPPRGELRQQVLDKLIEMSNGEI